MTSTQVTFADKWKIAASIIGFWVGILIIVFDAILQPPADPVSSGIGLILTGLGPVAALDLIRKAGS